MVDGNRDSMGKPVPPPANIVLKRQIISPTNFINQ